MLVAEQLPFGAHIINDSKVSSVCILTVYFVCLEHKKKTVEFSIFEFIFKQFTRKWDEMYTVVG